MTGEDTREIVMATQTELPNSAQLHETIARATDMARSLADIITANNLAVQIGQGKHIRVEAWQTVGRFVGYVARSRELPHDGPGRKALAEIVRLSDGMVVSTATHECGTEGDDVWANRPPNMQASMAQTRAVGKAFRNVLSWIVVLAGYEPTPYEEMPRDAGLIQHQAPTRSGPQSSPTAPRGTRDGGMCEEHGVEFVERTNSKTQEIFYSHQIQGGGWCHPPREAPETHRRAARSNAGPPSDLIDQETAMQAEMDARSGDNMEPPIASMGEKPSSEVSW
jgi:hypothetical protein